MSKTTYAVMERVGNFTHTLEEFGNRDEAAEFMLNEATKDAQAGFTCDQSGVPIIEWEEALENALSYYSIDRWEVRND